MDRNIVIVENSHLPLSPWSINHTIRKDMEDLICWLSKIDQIKRPQAPYLENLEYTLVGACWSLTNDHMTGW